MGMLDDFVVQIEIHSVEGIRQGFANGINPNGEFNGEPLFSVMTSMYTRTPRFTQCVQAFVEAGLQFADKPLLAVLLDDADTLATHLATNPSLITRQYTMQCTYTPLEDVTMLHICAEYNLLACAHLLLSHGADVNARAAVDNYGFGGQTPVFHTVNQNGNNSKDVLALLLAQGADLDITVKGLVWGKGFEWETLMPAVNPISYAMMGLLPQVHRREETIVRTVAMLLKHQYGIDYTPNNIPNAYLKK